MIYRRIIDDIEQLETAGHDEVYVVLTMALGHAPATLLLGCLDIKWPRRTIFVILLTYYVPNMNLFGQFVVCVDISDIGFCVQNHCLDSNLCQCVG